MHSTTIKVNDITRNCYFECFFFLIYVTYVTVNVGEMFVQAILKCSIDIQQADNMKKVE